MISKDWMEEVNTIINLDSSWRLLTIAAIILVLLLLYLVSRRRKKTLKVRLLDKTLRQLSIKEARSIVIPDGIGGMLEVERLILMEQGLLVLETYPLAGHLFGADRIDQWTQIVDGRSYKFANPLRHVHNSKHALQMLAPKVPIYCRVVFTGQGDFPKGKPDEVSVIATLEQDLRVISEGPRMSTLSQKAWQRIIQVAEAQSQTTMKEATQ